MHSQCVAYHASQKRGCLLKAACNNIQEISPNYFIPKPMKALNSFTPRSSWDGHSEFSKTEEAPENPLCD